MKFNKVFNNTLIALGIRKKPAPKKTSEILAFVKTSYQKPKFISDSLCIVASQVLSDLDYQRFNAVIRPLLGASPTLDRWVRGRGGISDYEFYAYKESGLLQQKLYATRVAWLDYLIEEYKQKGD